ncbi:hypothetical protein A3H38_03940 [candidate division WOR-1 bacterium RIFCSPLOWO2_02_FULL_46_20]|uniref:Uncharacterized protein n=2 Tax=Saganbacteria TaxID=1703751 RepID=A0A1F4RC56_UNCSA|nr:MAG: hypothetical protein A3J44_01660 [candidate division WOR-1 bacterium RIFCSPHIGHO2_02_FULL_45_12]OGC05764.1 MAG: hypothetical protein A3H38_03940 [candidate division WOR-1 bacterium RIFCSPLOWO2_02_FULL_46_20]OGC10177.1 MAG: hypothetical protein A3F86_04230 [candidate division WOR-1 bacterium RIFCSPLOWO2_12_FULL_45_9]
MSALMAGISKAASFTTQINDLRSVENTGPQDPGTFQLALQQNFNTMLQDLISATSDNNKDDDRKSDSNNLFANLLANNQVNVDNLLGQGLVEDAGLQADLLQNNIPNLQSFLNTETYLSI